MAKTTVEELVRSARGDALFEEEYTSRKAHIRRAMSEALFGLRKRAQLTQAALAQRAGWQQPYVARIERGDAQMVSALEGLEAFAHATGTTAVVLFVDAGTSEVSAQVSLGDAPAELAMREMHTAYEELARMHADVLNSLDEHLERVAADVKQLRSQGLQLEELDLNATSKR